MSDIVERLRFDAVRCELHFSNGVADNIEEGIAEIERLRRDCAELYQVVGVLAEEAGLFEDREVTKALDNANAAANGLPRPHEDILPFIPRAADLCPGGLPCDVSQGCPYNRIQCAKALAQRRALEGK